MKQRKVGRTSPGKPAAQGAGVITVTMLPVNGLRPSGWNANVMSAEDEAQLRGEVRRLGRPPKPIVVRGRGKGYQIVDGEHSWKAARECGLAEVPCEVIDADDFEAMRQSLTRNRHGENDPVRLGRLFRRMMRNKRLSGRKLGHLVGQSEGTIRNFVRYAEAAAVRNGYAPETADATVGGLPVAKVRLYLALPEGRRDEWLDRGASGDEANRILEAVKRAKNSKGRAAEEQAAGDGQAQQAAVADEPGEEQGEVRPAGNDDGEGRDRPGPANAVQGEEPAPTPRAGEALQPTAAAGPPEDGAPLSEAEQEVMEGALRSYSDGRPRVRQKILAGLASFADAVAFFRGMIKEGDLLDGRRCQEPPEAAAVPQEDGGEGDALTGRAKEVRQGEDEDAGRERQRQEEERRQVEEQRRAEEDAARERKRQRQAGEESAREWERKWMRRETKRLRDELEAATGREQERRREAQGLRSGLRQQEQQLESLRAQLERLRADSESERKNWQARLKTLQDELFKAARTEIRWQMRADDLMRRAREAERLFTDLCQLVFGGGFTPNIGGGVVPPSVRTDVVVLGLRWPCTREEVEKAHRQKAFQHHPDRGGNPEDFKRMQRAYERIMEALDRSRIM
jgi:ParB-like chromosome segregation protein Spo0J